MKKLILVLAVAMTAISPCFADSQGRLQLLLGSKSLDNDWGNFDQQSEFGLELDAKDRKWPVWVTAGYFASKDEDTVQTSVSPVAFRDVEAKTQEFHAGIKKDFDLSSRLRITLGAGPAWISGKMDRVGTPFDSDSDSAVGFWGVGDVLVFLGPVGVGFSYRYSQADIDLFGRSLNAGGHHIGFSAGFGW